MYICRIAYTAACHFKNNIHFIAFGHAIFADDSHIKTLFFILCLQTKGHYAFTAEITFTVTLCCAYVRQVSL